MVKEPEGCRRGESCGRWWRERNVGAAPTEGQLEKSRKLAYVSFSRAEDELGIILFTPSPEEAKQELIERFGLGEDQITVDG